MAINPVRDDLVVPLGQNKTISVKFFSDEAMTQPIDMSSKSISLTIKKNNSDEEAVISRSQVIDGSSASFYLSPGDTEHLGEGQSWYDIWVQRAAGGLYSQALVYGSITVEKLTS